MPSGPFVGPVPGTTTPPGGVTTTAPNSGQRVSNVDIVNAARDAGFRDDRWPNDPAGRRHSELAWAAAIALAESGGDRTAVGNPGDGHVYIGLWQIQRTSLTRALFSPDANAKAAWGLYDSRGRRFEGTWSVFPDPARIHLAQAETAVKGTHKDRPGITRPLQWQGFTNMLEAVSFLVGWITDGQTWIRLGEVLGGAVLVLLGLILLVYVTKGEGSSTSHGVRLGPAKLSRTTTKGA